MVLKKDLKAVKIVNTSAVNAQAASTAMEPTSSGSAPVKAGDYYLRCKSDVVQISTKKKSGYKDTPMAAWNVFTNGKKAYYIFTKDSTTSLYKYTFSTGKTTAVKKLNNSGVYWSIGTIYKGNAYLTKNSEESWKMWTYRLNLSTKKNVKVATNCDIVSRSGAYVVGANEYATDVSPIKISLYKITSSGLEKIKVLTKNGRGATFVGKNVSHPLGRLAVLLIRTNGMERDYMAMLQRIADGASWIVEKARLLCKEKHLGQVDKEGKPYYLHPFAVARAVEGEDEKVVAYLHDVVEDTDTTLDDLRMYGFSERVVDAVGAMTRSEGEEYFDYIERVKGNGLARVVKLADLAHNTDPSRSGATPEMLERYERAKTMLRAG